MFFSLNGLGSFIEYQFLDTFFSFFFLTFLPLHKNPQDANIIFHVINLIWLHLKTKQNYLPIRSKYQIFTITSIHLIALKSHDIQIFMLNAVAERIIAISYSTPSCLPTSQSREGRAQLLMPCPPLDIVLEMFNKCLLNVI